jgi:hypothetical protein
MTILDDVKYGLGILPGNDGFDNELLMYINTVGAVLVQFGVSQYDIVIDDESEWPTLDNQQIEALVQHYTTIKVKLVFDPSANQTITTALEASLPELEGRIKLIVEEVEAGA